MHASGKRRSQKMPPNPFRGDQLLAKKEAVAGHLKKLERIFKRGVPYQRSCKSKTSNAAEGDFVVLNDRQMIPSSRYFPIGLGQSSGDLCLYGLHNTLPRPMIRAAQIFESFFRDSGYTAFHPVDRSGVWRGVCIRLAQMEDIMVVIHVEPCLPEDRMDTLKESLVDLSRKVDIPSIYLLASSAEFNDSSSKAMHVVGVTDLNETICGVEFFIGPLTDFPAAPAATETLYSRIIDCVESNSKIICCGLNMLGLCLARRYNQVNLFDWHPHCEEILTDAELNNLDHVTLTKLDDSSGLYKKFVNWTSENGKDRSSKLVAILDLESLTSLSATRPIPGFAKVHRLVCVWNNWNKPDHANQILAVFEGLCSGGSLSFLSCRYAPNRAFAVELGYGESDMSLVLVLDRIF